MKVYISGPITGLPRRLAEARFRVISEYLAAAGHFPVNPMEIDNMPGCGCPVEEPTHTWECCLRKDLRQLVTCDAIYLITGWEKSRGARLELHVALELGLRLFPTSAGSILEAAAQADPELRRVA